MHNLLSPYPRSLIHAYYCGLWQHEKSSPRDGPGLIPGCLDQQSGSAQGSNVVSREFCGVKHGVQTLLFETLLA